MTVSLNIFMSIPSSFACASITYIIKSQPGSIEYRFVNYYHNTFYETLIDNSNEYQLEKGDLFELAYYNIDNYDRYRDIKFDFENMTGEEILRKILNYVDYYINKNS